MSTVLITGASGTIGRHLAARLGSAHEVIALSRRQPTEQPAGVDVAIRGDFASAADLRALDDRSIDVAVHLAAALDDRPEQECFAVNVLGTGTLLRYLVDHGCQAVVLASSIAATGCLSQGFAPRALPIDDDHPCEATDAYGASKALMEDLALYFQRQTPQLELVLMRIGGVLSDANAEEHDELLDYPLRFLAGGLIAIEDTVEALALAVEHRLGPGARRFNLVGPDSLYAMDRIRDAYGFVPRVALR